VRDDDIDRKQQQQQQAEKHDESNSSSPSSSLVVFGLTNCWRKSIFFLVVDISSIMPKESPPPV
jgi:hypothetical protein